jgi:hypothetical protein
VGRGARRARRTRGEDEDLDAEGQRDVDRGARHGDQGSRHQPDRARQIDVGRREERPDETLQWACVIRCAVGATDRGNPSLRRAQTWRTMAKGRWQ